MGAKTWMLMYADGDIASVLRSHPQPDRDASRAVLERLHPEARLSPLEDGNLAEDANPRDGKVYAGVYPGLTVVTTEDVALDYPSRLPQRFVDEAQGRTLYLHAMHSVVDWFAYAIWVDGVLRRSLSLAPEDGIIENIGAQLDFEKPYWAGEHPVEVDEDDPPYPFVFHPLELGEEALRHLFGFNYEGWVQDDDPDLFELVLVGYRRS
ncbi:DUF6928 family protein [Kribbella shirazensis]|uniref:Uncharacterized protein n=1 Tax=Kribbella shirazensis TaxID=1105143 RepID=A0A7X5V8L7_9ACTN|nr:hypothetical protein [Kribbella shirazensis]NIK56640.1 hypothetical protein [Kribbella shirazensis]